VTLVSCHICGKRMELKDSIDTDTGRFCGDCYREITRDLTAEELERRASGMLWDSGFRTSSLWAYGVVQAVMALLLIASPNVDTLAFFGAVLSSFAAYALGVLMEVYGVRRRIVLTAAVFLGGDWGLPVDSRLASHGEDRGRSPVSRGGDCLHTGHHVCSCGD